MLARPNRLRKPHEIARVYKKGVYGGGGGVVSVKSAPSGHTDTRVVVVVSKKISKHAVVRNRCRRRLVGLLEQHWATVRPGYDIVISVHRDVSNLAAPDLWQQLASALQRSGATSV